MKRLLLILFLAGLIFLLFSCENKNTENAKDGEHVDMPLRSVRIKMFLPFLQ